MMGPPSDEEVIAALNSAAQGLTKAAGSQSRSPAQGAAAHDVAGDLIALARADRRVRARAEAVFVPPLKTALEQLRAC